MCSIVEFDQTGSLREDQIGGPFGDHHGRGGGIARSDGGHHRGIDHAQAGDAAHLQPRIGHRVRVAVCAHFRGAHRVEDGGADFARRMDKVGIGGDLSAGPMLDGAVTAERGRRHDAARQPDRIDRDGPVFRR